MKKILILLLALPHLAFAQDGLKGQVKDAKSAAPMSHVNVYLKKSSIGGMTNEEGTFEIQIQEYHQGDTLVFSHLGYQDFKIPLNQLHTPLNVQVALKENSIALQTLVVTPLKIEKILEQVIGNLDQNYWYNKVELKGNIKNVTQFEGKIERLLYADILLSADKKGALDLSLLKYQFKRSAPAYDHSVYAVTTELLLDNLNLKKYLALWYSKLSKFDTTSVRRNVYGDYAVYELDMKKNIAPQKKYQIKLIVEQTSKAVIAVQIYGDKLDAKRVADMPEGKVTQNYRSSAGEIYYRPYKDKWILSGVKADLSSDCHLLFSKSQKAKDFTHYNWLEINISECLFSKGQMKTEAKRVHTDKDIFLQIESNYSKMFEKTPNLTATELKFLNHNEQ